jgi:hypothetical protein
MDCCHSVIVKKVEINDDCCCETGGFQRRFVSEKEELEKLEKYRDHLKKELEGLDEHLQKLKK